MIGIDTFLNKLKKQSGKLETLASCWKSCSFSARYDVDEMAISKGTLFLYVSSGIARKDMEIHSRTILDELNSRLPRRSTVKNIKLKARRK